MPTLTLRGPLCLAGALALSASALTGCHFFNHLLGKDSVDLSKADVQSMSVDIRKERKTICPREPVQMAIFIDAILDGEKEKKSFETYTGHSEANKNDKLEFVDFAFNSELGGFDKDGWFAPNPSMLASVDKEFLIKTVYKKRPDKFSFDTKYKPDYQCIKGGGKGGEAGASGGSGSPGQSGHDGQYGSDSQSGGQGSAGGQGSPGADGSNGGAGPHIVAFATYAKTSFYDKLVAIKIGGDLDDFLLAPIDQPLVLSASGGSGGKGGSGGAGGTLELVFDARYPDLANLFKLDVSGGAGGDAGSAGNGGSGGGSGSGITPQGSQSSVASGQRGSDGSNGGSGAPGQKGPDGHGSTKAGAVADHFSGLAGVTLLDDGAAAPVAAPVKGAKPAKTAKKPGAAK
jgi:hypothetical protein